MYGTGISKTGEMVDIGVMYNVIQKSGAWFSYGDMRLGQGRENVKAYFEQNPEFAAEIEEKIRVAMKKGADDEKATAKSAAKAAAAPRSVEAAKARLDVTVDDDDD